MFYAIGIVFAALWLVGILTAMTFNGFIHVLLALAILSIIVEFVRSMEVPASQ